MSKYEILQTAVIVEGFEFTLYYEKGTFYFCKEFSKFLNTKINSAIVFSEINELLSIDFGKTTNYDFVNLATFTENQYICSQKATIKKGIVYLVSDGTFTKIGGTSNNLSKRVVELQTGNAKKLEILGSYKTSYLLQSERLIQNKYKDFNVLNEWFKLDDSQINDILSRKETFKDNSFCSGFSNLSMINIMFAQYTILRNLYDQKSKVLTRIQRKIINPVSADFINKVLDKRFSNETIMVFYDKNKFRNAFDLSNQYKKELKHLQQIGEYMNFLNKHQIDYMEDNNFFYADDEDIYIDGKTDFPLRYYENKDML